MRVLITVAYDGTDLCGWQSQPNGITVQEILEKHLSELLGEEIRVIGASRTDSGVHSMGNLAVFDTNTKIPAEKISYAMNQRLPETVRILSSREAAPDFHPRRINCRKTYVYRIWNSRHGMPLYRLYSYFVFTPLDAEKMRKAAAYLIGEHDFTSFCSAHSSAEDPIRTLYRLDVETDGPMITLRVTGNGFLYNMVRIMAGTLIRVGQGMIPPEKVREILMARDRQAAPQMAPARGLTLVSVEPEESLPEEIRASGEEWSYVLREGAVPETGDAFLELTGCREGDIAALASHLLTKAGRDGAKRLFVTDPKGLLSGLTDEQKKWKNGEKSCDLVLDRRTDP